MKEYAPGVWENALPEGKPDVKGSWQPKPRL